MSRHEIIADVIDFTVTNTTAQYTTKLWLLKQTPPTLPYWDTNYTTKGKVVPNLITSFGHGADPGSLAVSLQLT